MRRLTGFNLTMTFILVCFIIGCSESKTPIREDSDELPPLGIWGNTYRNGAHVFKVANLPIDDWTVLAESEPADRKRIGRWSASFATGPHINRGDDVLLMQPSKDDFQETVVDALANEMPFIDIYVEKQTATDWGSARNFAEHVIEQNEGIFEVASQGDIRSADGVLGYFFDATFDDGSKATRTYFVRASASGKKPKLHVFWFWAPKDSYDDFKSTYDAIVSSLQFNTH